MFREQTIWRFYCLFRPGWEVSQSRIFVPPSSCVGTSGSLRDLVTRAVAPYCLFIFMEISSLDPVGPVWKPRSGWNLSYSYPGVCVTFVRQYSTRINYYSNCGWSYQLIPWRTTPRQPSTGHVNCVKVESLPAQIDIVPPPASARAPKSHKLIRFIWISIELSFRSFRFSANLGEGKCDPIWINLKVKYRADLLDWTLFCQGSSNKQPTKNPSTIDNISNNASISMQYCSSRRFPPNSYQDAARMVNYCQ